MINDSDLQRESFKFTNYLAQSTEQTTITVTGD